MTTIEDDESLERELFTRRERALDAQTAPPVPRLEDVLRAADAANDRPRASNVVPFTRMPRKAERPVLRAVLLVAACAAAMVAIAPGLRHLVAAAPEATIRPEPAPRSAPPPSMTQDESPSSPRSPSPPPMPAVSTPPASTFNASFDPADTCGGRSSESSSSCEQSCESDSP